MRLHCAGVRFLTGNEGAPVILLHPDAIRHPKGHLAYLDDVMRLLSSMRAICGIAIEAAAARLLQSDIMKPLPSSRIPPIHSGRPRSLGEVVLMGKQQGDIDSFLREFLDEFYQAKEDTTREAMLHDEPPRPDDWLNDGVKGFTSANEKMVLMKSFEGSPDGGLRIYTPSPEYLFAMKCMAMRPEGIEGSHDITDIELLVKEIGINDAAAALSLVEAFYPSARIPPKVRFGVEEIMERMANQPIVEAKNKLNSPAEHGGLKTSQPQRRTKPRKGGDIER